MVKLTTAYSGGCSFKTSGGITPHEGLWLWLKWSPWGGSRNFSKGAKWGFWGREYPQWGPGQNPEEVWVTKIPEAAAKCYITVHILTLMVACLTHLWLSFTFFWAQQFVCRNGTRGAGWKLGEGCPIPLGSSLKPPPQAYNNCLADF